MSLPLSDITVVSLEQAIAAPLASRHLADLGARVIKIERPGVGDFARHYDGAAQGLCSHFVWANRSKESLTLNLKTEAGQKILAQLLTQADVFIQNLAPGALERLGFKRLQADYPRLVVCQISGYGSDGPYRDKKAYDLLVQAETGVVSVTGSEEEAAKAGIPVADIAGAMYAYSSILAALFQRQRTNSGTVLHVSLFDGLCEWMGFPAYYSLGDTRLPRAGASHAAIMPYGPFPSGDGRTILFGIQNQGEWERFCAIVLEKPAVAMDPRFADNTSRVQNRALLRAEIESVFIELTLGEVVARLERAQVANAVLRDVRDFWQHPQLVARARVREVESPLGPLPALHPAMTAANWPPRFDPIPATGSHTLSLLTELGYEPHQIQRLQDEGVV